ncbi:hypothetical protein ACFZAX_16630, partial [Streptomyces sp. NPDC008125]
MTKKTRVRIARIAAGAIIAAGASLTAAGAAQAFAPDQAPSIGVEGLEEGPGGVDDGGTGNESS